MNQCFKLLRTFVGLSGVVIALIACSGESTPPPNTTPPVKKEEPPPPPPPEPTAEPASSGTPDAGPPPTSQSSERPPVLKSAESEITDTFGVSPGAKLELGTSDADRATLRIRENSLDRGYNITFKVDKKGKSTGAPAGNIYHTIVQVAGENTFPEVTSADRPFELTLPTNKKANLNLAMGELSTDDKGHQKITWTIVAPKKVDDAMGTAYFELSTLSEMFLHLTAKAPTAPAQK